MQGCYCVTGLQEWPTAALLPSQLGKGCGRVQHRLQTCEPAKEQQTVSNASGTTINTSAPEFEASTSDVCYREKAISPMSWQYPPAKEQVVSNASGTTINTSSHEIEFSIWSQQLKSVLEVSRRLLQMEACGVYQ